MRYFPLFEVLSAQNHIIYHQINDYETMALKKIGLYQLFSHLKIIHELEYKSGLQIGINRQMFR